MKVLHISPKYFDQEIGGGERYPWELTKALAKYANVSLVVFGSKRETEKVSDNLTIEVYPSFRLLVFNNINPLSISFARQVRSADIIHCHQFRTVVSNISILFAKLWRRPVCVTDYGGGGWNFAPFLGLGHLVDCFLLISEFSTQSFWRFGKKREIIYGGVDISKFHPQPIEREKKVLFVGRIMPHKGIDYLVKAIQDLDCRLRVVGVPSNSQYLELLKSIDRTNRLILPFASQTAIWLRSIVVH